MGYHRAFGKSGALLLLLFAAALLPLGAETVADRMPFDVLIVHGRIVDGTGSPWYSGNIGIRGGKIAAIGNLAGSKAKQTIDTHGQVVAPGFIDMLGQSELTSLVNPRLPSKIFQGITTEVTGEGESAAPLNSAMIAADRATYDHLHIDPDWTNFHEYFSRLER